METLTVTTAPSRIKRRVLWTSVTCAVLLLLAFTPPLLNVNRLRRRIAESMSASLGRPVHMDRVTVHLLPVPGFTLENLVVSEDPAFGFEPTIRANTVEATLRPASLWRRQVEFSTIRFIEPSLNLVRNPQGRWNLQSLLVHAANVDTAPTAQRKAGPEPRFPYIEATGARVNLKLGEEKKPFSLTDADFALWLPTPAQWRVRLEAKPARTDTNISDPGIVRLEGSLQRAPALADVPVDLRASWEAAPLGEASRLLTGSDAEWRGSLIVEATLQGKLGAATLATRLHFEDLRRADFVPAKSLDVQVECNGTLEIMTALVHNPACALVGQKLTAVAESVDLTQLSAAGFSRSAALYSAPGIRIGSPGIAEAWLLDWAGLFSQRMPPPPPGKGTVRGSLLLAPTSANLVGRWQGQVDGDVANLLSKPSTAATHTTFSVITADGSAILAPLNLLPADSPNTLMLTGSATREGYTLRLDGTLTPAQMQTLRAKAPPLSDGIMEAVPDLFNTASTRPIKVDVTCTRTWKGPQTCATQTAEPPRRPPPKHPTSRR
jgi:AsmA protein